MTISRFHVTGMDCTAEERLVRMALSDLEAVNRVEVHLDRRDVIVDHIDDTSEIGSAADSNALIAALVINAGFFISELTVGVISRSVGFIADALDMGADASVYALSLAAVDAAATRKKLARASGYLQIGLATVGLVEMIRRFLTDIELPDPTSMILLSALALAGNLATVVTLQRVRSGEAHLQASWIFTANDIKLNGLVITAAIGVALTGSAMPDVIAGAIIFAVGANDARRILNIRR